MTKMVPVILCGGTGTRLWPRSRSGKPKPFLPLIGQETLFDEALRRCSDSASFDPPVIVTGEALLELTETERAKALGSRIIVEPEPKNTAAAVALAALRLPGDSIMLVCPSDHHIEDHEGFVEKARAAAALAAEGLLVCLGIEARSPETRFGYLRRGEPIGSQAFKVAEFTEKPEEALAIRYSASNEHFWNAGIFAFRASDYLAELELHRPKLAAAVRRSVEAGQAAGQYFRPDARAFGEVDGESLDYAVMENTDRAALVPARIGWSDLGNWSAIHAARPRDDQGNSVSGPVDLVDCRNVLVDTDGPSVSVVGLDDLIVVVDGDDIMITTSRSSHDIGKLSRARGG